MGFDEALAATRAWTRRSYNSSTWEHLIAGRSRPTPSCLLGLLGIECPPDRREEVALRAAGALRRRHPDLTDSPAAWTSKRWTDAEIAELVAIVGAEATRVLGQPRSTASRGNSVVTPDGGVGPHGFSSWRPFSRRVPVPDAEGVYLVALGEGLAGAVADPMDARVLYIGMTERRGLRVRLDEFESGALSCAGHTGGWHYRTEVYPDDWASLTAFRDTFVAWRETPGDARRLESGLRSAYESRWGRLPRLNRV